MASELCGKTGQQLGPCEKPRGHADKWHARSLPNGTRQEWTDAGSVALYRRSLRILTNPWD